MKQSWKSVAIGLGLPSAALLVVLPLIADTSVYVLNMPLVFFWVFAWFPLTSLCLWVAWRIDAPHYPETGPGEEVGLPAGAGNKQGEGAGA